MFVAIITVQLLRLSADTSWNEYRSIFFDGDGRNLDVPLTIY